MQIVSFFCIECKAQIDPEYRACPYCGEAITDFLRKYIGHPIDGKYQIIARLGMGGMGEVYKVLHLHLDSIRVVKLMRPNLSDDPDANQRFIREAQLASRVQHPSVAALYDFSILDDGTQYMVWEYIEGRNLLEVIRARGTVEPLYTVRIAIEALRGLDAIHRAGIVHRDVSPENLMITRDDEGNERVKIIDLGIAKRNEETSQQTKTGIFVGKWKYCSPEHLGMLAADEQIDGRADLYSFGIVMYEMLTGVPPFVADTPHGYLLKHAREEALPLLERNPRLQAVPELENLIFRALAKNRDDRFPTARDFARQLEALEPSLAKLKESPPTRDFETRVGKLPDEDRSTRRTSSDPFETADTDRTVTDDVHRPPPTYALPLDQVEDSGTPLSDEGASLSEPPPTLMGSPYPAGFDQATLDRPPGFASPEEPPARSHALLWIVLVLAVALGGGFVYLRWSGGRAPDVSEPTSATTSASVTPVPSPAGSIRLGLNAFPWGEVVAIRNVASGQPVALPSDLTTPASIELPPGRYEVVMRNPAFGDARTTTVDLQRGRFASVMIRFRDPGQDEQFFGGETP